MDTLLFLITIISVLVLLIRLIVKLVRRKSIAGTSKLTGIILLAYSIIWLIFYGTAANQIVPLATDICFDDWCATVIKIDKPESLGTITAKGQFIILHIKMSNHARGIAQKPSEPRVHISDSQNNLWAVSARGQQAFEKIMGKQIALDQKLELHQSLETQFVFDVPKNANDLEILIEEGPFITKFLIPGNKKVFKIQ